MKRFVERKKEGRVYAQNPRLKMSFKNSISRKVALYHWEPIYSNGEWGGGVDSMSVSTV
jgi:hypothetical protein